MDWGINSYLKLASNTLGSPFLVDLIHNHVLILTNDHSGAPEIRVINIAAFSGRWQRAADAPSLPTVYVSDVEAVIGERITFGKYATLQPLLRRELYAFQSPLEAGTYRIWLILSGYRTKRHAVLCSYCLSLIGDGITGRERTAAKADPTLNCAGITYAGHIRRDNHGGRCSIFAPGALDHVVEQNLPGALPYAPLSPYNGALAYVEDRALVVSSFT
ncbi:hypothetical protein FB451DRAFT_1285792, partial [Mycena latifolia]